MRPRHPRDDPRAYFAAFVALLAVSVAFPEGFLLVAITGGVVVVAATIALAATGRFRQFK